jgi:hypothetical protein
MVRTAVVAIARHALHCYKMLSYIHRSNNLRTRLSADDLLGGELKPTLRKVYRAGAMKQLSGHGTVCQCCNSAILLQVVSKSYVVRTCRTELRLRSSSFILDYQGE